MAIKVFDKYSPRANAPDSNYPDGSIKNESVPGANDGTPLDQDWGNDWEGFKQSVLNDAEIEANGTPDSVSNPQILNAIKKSNAKVFSNENLIPNSDFSIAGSVANPPDATTRSYSAGDELFYGFFAASSLSGVTYVNGKLNGTGQLYVDVYKTEKQSLSTTSYVASIASSDGDPVESGASFVDNGDYWRVTFNMNDTFSVKLEQGDIATSHHLGDDVVNEVICKPGDSLDEKAQLAVRLNRSLHILGGATYPYSNTLPGDKIRIYGDGGDNTILMWNGSSGDWAAEMDGGEFGATIDFLRIEAASYGKKGIFAKGNLALKAKQLYIDNFTNYPLRIGDTTSASGNFWSEFSLIRIDYKKALESDPAWGDPINGVLIDGTAIPSSNANMFCNVVIGGNYQIPLHIKGNGNIFDLGTIEFSEGSKVNRMIKIEGGGNIIRGTYIESTSIAPDKLCEFTAGSSGNEVELWSAMTIQDNVYARVIDEGRRNTFVIKSRGDNFNVGLPFEDGANIVFNSDFNFWSLDGSGNDSPKGWWFSTPRISEGLDFKESGKSIVMTESNSNSTIQCYLTDAFNSSLSNIPQQQLSGKAITACIWCKTDIPLAGNIKISSTTQSSAGKEVHSGGGNWELLTASIEMENAPLGAVGNVFIELRSEVDNSPITGVVSFSNLMVTMTQQPKYWSLNASEGFGPLLTSPDGLTIKRLGIDNSGNVVTLDP